MGSRQRKLTKWQINSLSRFLRFLMLQSQIEKIIFCHELSSLFGFKSI